MDLAGAHKKVTDLEIKIEELENEVEDQKQKLEARDLQIRDITFANDVKITELNFKMECKDRECELSTDEKINELRDKMQQSLNESDIRRVRAEAMLETYEKLDTGDERKQITGMLSGLLKDLPKMKSDVVVNNSTKASK